MMTEKLTYREGHDKVFFLHNEKWVGIPKLLFEQILTLATSQEAPPSPGVSREPKYHEVRKAVADGIEAGITSWCGQHDTYKSFEPISIDYAGISERITKALFSPAHASGETNG